MIRHYFKLIWERKRKNGFLLAELIVSFWIFLGVFSFAIDQYKVFRMPRGFETQGVYSIYIGYKTNLLGIDSLSQKSIGDLLFENLGSMPEIAEVSCSSTALPYSGARGSRGYGAGDGSGQMEMIEQVSVDENFQKVWSVEMASGRFFEKNDPVELVKTPLVINEKLEALMKRWDFVQKRISEEYQVVGVVKHFKYDGDFKEEKPLMFNMTKGNPDRVYSVKVKAGEETAVLPRIYKMVEKITKGSDFEIKILKNEQRKANRASVIPLFTLLFIGIFLVISIVMGLLGVLKYNMNSRVAEVGLRKVMGATTADIRKMFVGEMITLTLIAFMVAMLFALQVPFVSNFPIERSSYFAGMALGTLLIFGLVLFCSALPGRQLARILPAEALREE